MTRKEAKEKAIEVKNTVTDFNNPSDEIGYDLYEFELDGNNLVVFAYIRKAKGTDGRKWYAVYSGCEYDGGDTIWADYDSSTTRLRIDELADAIYRLANMYTDPDNLEELRKMINNT